jgi:hypothetical protein
MAKLEKKSLNKKTKKINSRKKSNIKNPKEQLKI